MATFLDLPVEIRLIIYNLLFANTVLQVEGPIRHGNNGHARQRTLARAAIPSFCLVNRMLYNETIGLYHPRVSYFFRGTVDFLDATARWTTASLSRLQYLHIYMANPSTGQPRSVFAASVLPATLNLAQLHIHVDLYYHHVTDVAWYLVLWASTSGWRELVVHLYNSPLSPHLYSPGILAWIVGWALNTNVLPRLPNFQLWCGLFWGSFPLIVWDPALGAMNDDDMVREQACWAVDPSVALVVRRQTTQGPGNDAALQSLLAGRSWREVREAGLVKISAPDSMVVFRPEQ